MLRPNFPKISAWGFPSRQNRNGVALIVVLFAVALVSIVVLAYFNLAMMNRNISFSSAGEARANIVALSALDYVKGDLISEIQYGSTLEVDPNGSKVPVYYPSTNTTMVPYRMTANLASPDYTLPPNLVKWSSGTVAQWTNSAAYGTQAGPIRGSTSSTTSPAINGHFLNSSFWTKPVFGTNAAFSAAATPQWVYLSRSGPLTPTVATAGNMTALNNANSTNYVIGRYAYTVYDEGGLLDVAAAGYSPDTMASDPTDVGRKGSQGFADLTQLGLSQPQVDELVGWRNSTSASNAAAYLGYLTTNAPATGFITAATNDQAFVSRQDLIAFWTSPTQMNLATTAGTNALTYLTTFTREKNAPSWGPEHDAADPNSATYWNGTNTEGAYYNLSVITLNPPSGGISYAYHANKDNPNPSTAPAYNRFFPNVRVTTPFVRLSNKTAVVGEPLVKNRFDLTKLAWITYEGPSADLATSDPLYNPLGTDANIYKYFGLVANYSAATGNPFMSWTYNHTTETVPTSAKGTPGADTTQIMTLDQIAAVPREPDFFELLQATILRGSLGLSSGDPAQASNLADGGVVNENDAGGEFYRAANFPQPPAPLIPVDDAAVLYRPIGKDGNTPPRVVYAQPMFQVIQIGANIIDQYTSDNFPTDIILYGENFYGTKNLPYISTIGDVALRPSGVPSIPSTGSSITAATTQYEAYVHRWIDFGLWNPHQNAQTPPAVGPTVFRICVAAGQEFPYLANLGKFAGTSPLANTTPVTDYMGRIFEEPGTAIGANAQVGFVDGPAWIEFKMSDYANHFAVPTALTTANTSDANGGPNINNPDGITQTAAGWQRAGIYLGWSKSPDNPYKVPPCVAIWPNYASAATASATAGYVGLTLPTVIERDSGYYYYNPLKVYLQYEDTASPATWHTYQELHNFYNTRAASVSGDAYMETADPNWSAWATIPPTNPAGGAANTKPVTQLVWGVGATFSGGFLTNMDSYVNSFLDPRSVRPNLFALRTNPSYVAGGSAASAIVTSTLGSTGVTPTKGISTGPHYSDPGNINDTAWAGFAKTWVDNVSHPSPIKNYDVAGTSTYYTDRDFVSRTGDAGGWTNASPLPAGTQLQAPSPLQLDRPFRSVAELGYVFRDDPWKTLNLISANSADSGLLDIFSIGSNTNSGAVPPPDVIAGKMNLNSAEANAASAGTTLASPVLQALISQTLQDYQSAASVTGNSSTINSSLTTTANIQSLSSSLLTYLKTSGPLMNIADVSGVYPQVPAATFPAPLYTGLKNPSEALVRSLAGSAGTRTWNLMIDVVAQAGKFNPNAANLNSFTVDGEKHYWLHVAIDRFTGEIVDEQLEPVWE